jgi:addiction module RelB/DinJ family antitoxin
MESNKKAVITKDTRLEVVSAKIDSNLKKEVEKILNRLGIGQAEAIKLLYNQIALTGSIPFSIAVPRDYIYPSDTNLQNKKKRGRPKGMNKISDFVKEGGI